MRLNNIEVEENLLYEIRGLLATFQYLFLGHCDIVEQAEQATNLWFAMDVLRQKYDKLLQQMGWLKPEEEEEEKVIDMQEAKK